MDVLRKLKVSLKSLQSPVFYKTFLILASITIASVVSSALISLSYSSNHIIDEVSKSNMIMLSEKSHNADEKLREIDKIIYQSISDSNIWNIMKTEEFTENHYLMIRDITKLFNNIILTNDVISSINLYDTKHSFVITNTTKYTKGDFYDQDLFKYGNKVGIVYFSPPRIVNNHKVITYIRKFNGFSRDNIGYFAVNIDYDKLFGNIFTKDYNYDIPVIVTCEDLTPLYSIDKTVEASIRSSLQKIINSSQYYKVFRINGEKYFICKVPSEINDWKYISVQKYSSIVQPVDFLIKVIISSMFIVLLLLLILVYVFSAYLYRPLSKLMQSISRYITNDSSVKKNEYEIIDYLIKELHSDNSELLEKYNIAFPYFKEHSISEFISDANLDTNNFLLLIKLMNVQFNFPKYSVAIINFDNVNIQVHDRQFIEEYLKKYSSEMTCLVSTVDSIRMLIVCNTSLDTEEIYGVFKNAKSILNSKGILTTISVGAVFDDLSNLSIEYNNVLRQLDNRFFIGKNQILFNMGHNKDFQIPDNDCRIREKLINYIKSCNKEKAFETFDEFISQYMGLGAASIDYTRYICFQLVSDILDHIKEYKFKDTESEIKEFEVFQNIQNSETIDILKEFVTLLICKSIDIIDRQKKNQHSEMINKILDFTNQNYTKPLTLDDVAGHVFMSSKYICTIFKDEMGMTVFDYITKLRMEKAKELLLISDLQIQNIGMQVGYNNVQSFIRFFKRYWMLTPEQFRRKYRDYDTTLGELESSV